MNNVTFILKKADESLIELEYKPFDFVHSQLWYKSIEQFVNSGLTLTDTDRVYNFNKYTSKNFDTEMSSAINACNKTIDDLNKLYPSNKIPFVYRENLQNDVNYVHTYFVEADRSHIVLSDFENRLWSKLNSQLHGLEILARSRGKKFRGSVFVHFPESVSYKLPEDSFRHFSVNSKFGMCYSNYPHTGRHIHELFSAKDTVASDTHILPQSDISGDSYLWFGGNSNWAYLNYETFMIKRWFIKNNIEQRINMKWGDPRLAIGKLPVASIVTSVSKNDLYGIVKLVDVTIR